MPTVSKSNFAYHQKVTDTGSYEVNGTWYDVHYTRERNEDYLVIRKEVEGNGITEDTNPMPQLLMEKNSEGLWDTCKFKDFQAVTDYFKSLEQDI